MQYNEYWAYKHSYFSSYIYNILSYMVSHYCSLNPNSDDKVKIVFINTIRHFSINVRLESSGLWHHAVM